MAFYVTCRLLLDAECESGAADGANEILREQQRDYSPGSCLVDYALDSFTPTAIAPNYSEGDAFTGPNLAAAAPAMLAALQGALPLAAAEAKELRNAQSNESEERAADDAAAKVEAMRKAIALAEGVC